MNLAELQRKLVAVARANPPSDRVPHAFARRIMAHLTARPVDVSALWARALWRGAGACLAFVALVGALTFFGPGSGASSNDLSQDFQKTMLAAVDQDTDSGW